MPGMRRREFVSLFGGAAAAWPFAARAQQSSSILIGFLSASSAAAFTKEIDAFRDGLRKLGYIESRNVRLEYRFASGDLDELAVLGTELVQLKPTSSCLSLCQQLWLLRKPQAQFLLSWRLALTRSASAW